MENIIHAVEFSLAGIASFTLALLLAKASLSGLLDQLGGDRRTAEDSQIKPLLQGGSGGSQNATVITQR